MKFRGEKIEIQRKAAELSWESLSRDILKKGKYYISYNTIRNWEHGVRVPNANDLIVLSKYFQKPITYWFK